MAGRLPACSRPAWGLKFNQIKSPLPGMKRFVTTLPHLQAHPNQFRDDGFLEYTQYLSVKKAPASTGEEKTTP